MFEFARYDGRKRVRGSVAMAVLLAALAAMVVWVFPSFASAIDVEQFTEVYPQPIIEAFGVRSMGSLGGFLAVELYNFGWVILLGLYFAYTAASLVAGNVEDERMDMLLSLPVTRVRLLAETFGALAVPLVVVNVAVPVVVLVSAQFVDASIDVANLVAVHALSVPYLLVTAGIGLVFSVLLDREGVAQRAAMGVVFALFLLESVLANSDYEWLGGLAPMRYYDPTGVLVDGHYDLAGAGILLAAAAVLLVAGLWLFREKDIQ